MGPAITDWQSLPLEELAGTLQINGKTVSQGVTRDALGHPLEGLAWIVNTLTQQGKELETGMIVITGSIIATEFLSGNDTAIFEVEMLGETKLTLR